MTTKTPSDPIRLPVSIDPEAATYFDERRARADWDAFDRLMGRSGGAPPRPGDERP
jgi:hypothetical protein